MLNTNTTLYTSRSKSISSLFKKLIAQTPIRVHQCLRDFPILRSRAELSCVYVFSEPQVGHASEKVLYVGQTQDLAKRLEQHCAIKENKYANFAYMMTVKQTGIKPDPNSPDRTKKDLLDKNDRFKTEFANSVQFIMGLNFRFITSDDVLTKNLLEIYTAIVLESEFNNFG